MDARSSAGRARATAARIIARVLVDNRYLDSALEEARAIWTDDVSTFALVQELAYGTLRWYHQLRGIARLFVTRPFKPKDGDVDALLLLGLYQLRHMRVADHAAVDTTVRAAEILKKGWSKGVINACLRAYLRETARVEQAITASDEYRYSHPAWMIDSIRRQYPREHAQVLAANNQRPPLTLRVNTTCVDRIQYLATLQLEGIEARLHPSVDTALVLDRPVSVERLPQFATGHVSVQDAAAQLAAGLLDAQPGERVLDACAAPGGKTAHILERTPNLEELVAIDIDATRLERIRQNLVRLNLSASLLVADAADRAGWWDGKAYDRILLDVPCSATGVIRRHPDIKVRRQPGDLPKLCETQSRLLESVWPCLARGGKLLYATCSIFSDENDHQVRDFLARHDDAAADPITGNETSLGLQILPGDNDMDGFYYARLRKT